MIQYAKLDILSGIYFFITIFKELIFFMDPASSMQIAALIVLVLLSAFFSGTETAFTSFNKTRMKTLAGDGNKKAKAVM